MSKSKRKPSVQGISGHEGQTVLDDAVRALLERARSNAAGTHRDQFAPKRRGAITTTRSHTRSAARAQAIRDQRDQ